MNEAKKKRPNQHRIGKKTENLYKKLRVHTQSWKKKTLSVKL